MPKKKKQKTFDVIVKVDAALSGPVEADTFEEALTKANALSFAQVSKTFGVDDATLTVTGIFSND